MNLRTAVLLVGAITGLGSSACESTTDTSGTPPEDPTHHLFVEGEVRLSSGIGADTFRASAVYADLSPADRRISVIGNPVAIADGRYLMNVETFEPKAAGDTIHFFVHVTLLGSDGTPARADSLLVTGVAVPLELPPDSVIAPALTFN